MQKGKSMTCEDLNAETKSDLTEWYNSRKLTKGDERLLTQLWASGNFRAYDCGHCGVRVRQGQPDNWDKFQGVNDGEGIGSLCGKCYVLYLTLEKLAEY